MLEKIEVLGHSSIRIAKGKVIYFDPFKIKKEYHDANLIFITHSHYDHFSLEDIVKVSNNATIFVCPTDVEKKLLAAGYQKEKILSVLPNNKYEIQNIKFTTIPAYNIDKPYHPKENAWLGYIIEINNFKYYIAGDTDNTFETQNVKCDVAFLPIGGTYTMNYIEAAALANTIKPKIVVPIHYGTIIGNKNLATKFLKLLSKDIKGVILIK